MWLDRLSGHTTPSATPPASRPYSPAPPRRPSHLAPTSAAQRPPFSPRSSSLSLVSNDSSTSLLASSKRVNGSNLKQLVTVGDAPNPTKVLRGLIRPVKDKSSAKNDSSESTGAVGEDDGELDFGGLSLKEIVELSESGASLSGPTQSADEYDKEKEKFEDLHKSIRACDEVLSSVEVNLTSFQKDLAAVSAEIETLQARSSALSIRLENRKQVETGLGPIVEDISLSPAVVKKIIDGAIDEAWVKSLDEVEKRSKAMNSKTVNQKHIKGLADLKPLLENLISKALERIRDFLVAQIKALRSPNINAQIIQQQHFLKYKDLYTFLHSHHPELAEQIGQAYMNTMRWYYLAQFTRYQKSLDKVKLHVLDKYDALGQDDAVRRTSLLSTSKSTGPPHDAFNLSRRIDILRTASQSALSSFLAEDDKATHYLEFPFRNFNLALIDNASAEYSFLTTFFSPALSYPQITRNFNFIFEPTFALGQALTKTLVSDTYDSLGLLLCVRLNQHFAFELQRRKIPAVDSYINLTSMTLWPRFQVIMDSHRDSLRSLTSSLSTRKPSASEAAKQSAAPHFITQRFGQFMHSILTLSVEAGDDEPVFNSLMRLRSEVEMFLTKMSKGWEERKRERFLYNNYSLVGTIIGDVRGDRAAEQKEHFEGLKKAFEERG